MPPVNGSQQDQTHGAEALPSCESMDGSPAGKDTTVHFPISGKAKSNHSRFFLYVQYKKLLYS